MQYTIKISEKSAKLDLPTQKTSYMKKKSSDIYAEQKILHKVAMFFHLLNLPQILPMHI